MLDWFQNNKFTSVVKFDWASSVLLSAPGNIKCCIFEGMGEREMKEFNLFF